MVPSVESHSVSSRSDIVRLLQLAKSRNVPVTVALPDGTAAGLTTVLHADAGSDTLLVDPVQDNRVNHQLLAARRVAFETAVDHIGLAFETPGVSLVQHVGRPALRSLLPVSASYTQRRDTFRIDIPPEEPIVCDLQPVQGNRRAPMRMKVRNLSSTGVALADPTRLMDITPGTLYRGKLTLPGLDVFELSLRVVHHREEWLGLSRGRRVGCAFIMLEGSTLIRIQSYVDAMQRDQIARQRRRGLS